MAQPKQNEITMDSMKLKENSNDTVTTKHEVLDEKENGGNSSNLITKSKKNDDDDSKAMPSMIAEDLDFITKMTVIPDKPEEHFQLALKLEPQNSKLHCTYGMFLIQQEKYDLARSHFEVRMTMYFVQKI